jgi:hypothetical protein
MSSTPPSPKMLASVIGMIRLTTERIQATYPDAICVQVNNNDAQVAIPIVYKLWFTLSTERCLSIDIRMDSDYGSVYWSKEKIYDKPFSRAVGNLKQCTVDIFPAYKAIVDKGYPRPVYFCCLYQAVSSAIPEPCYYFTPNDCISNSTSDFILVNSVTSEVYMFPPGKGNLPPGFLLG